jgi:inner membrane protein
MDPIAHTLTGAALAATGLRRVTPLATAALVIGANAPDVDVLTSFAGSYASLALRRGWTHGVLALVVWPFVLTAILLLWDRWRRAGHLTRSAAPPGTQDPGPASPGPASPGPANLGPARAGPLLGLVALAVLTHPTLDWLNNYGMRWLMPFDGRWSYGDALFIVDPWVWLALGGVLFLCSSRSRPALFAWAAFWLFGTWLMVAVPVVPAPARALWIAGVLALAAARFLQPELGRWLMSERLARVALGCMVIYIAAALAASAVARREVRSTLATLGIGPITSVMVGPAAANPFAGTVVAATPDAYLLGEWRWFAAPRLRLAPEWIERRRADDPVVAAASRTAAARDYLTWSRYPYFEVEQAERGYVVHLRDARYHSLGALDGPDVHLDRDLRAAASAE